MEREGLLSQATKLVKCGAIPWLYSFLAAKRATLFHHHSFSGRIHSISTNLHPHIIVTSLGHQVTPDEEEEGNENTDRAIVPLTNSQ